MPKNFLALTTPTNLVEEKVKFFASTSSNPVFTYVWQKSKTKPATDDERKQTLYQAMLAGDSEALTGSAKLLFETDIDKETLDQAKRDAVEGQVKKHSGSAREYAALLESAFKEFSLDYSVEITDETGFNARPQPSKKRVVVSKAIHYEFMSMEGGVRHELVHILRYENEQYNHIARSPRYLPTEEGLASWAQDHTVADSGLAQHAAEYVGTAIGIRGSLRDIFNYFTSIGMSRELAWKRASRHKFGFTDTGKPGDLVKPAMYYANEMKVGKLSTEEKVRLFVGKISLSDLPDNPVYRGRWPAEHIVNYFKL